MVGRAGAGFRGAVAGRAGAGFRGAVVGRTSGACVFPDDDAGTDGGFTAMVGGGFFTASDADRAVWAG